MDNLDTVKLEYERENDYIVRGSVTPSRAMWFEEGERNNKHFLGLENSKKKKSCTRKLYQPDGKETTSPSTILHEAFNYYAALYDNKLDKSIDWTSCPFLDSKENIPNLPNEMSDRCDGEHGYTECIKALSELARNKTPGNDGLSVEFYSVLWPEIGRIFWLIL